jgi:hypothetical protein
VAFPQTPLDLEVDLGVGNTYMVSGSVPSQVNVFCGGGCWAYETGLFDAITGDFDLKIDVAATDWTPPVDQVLIGKNRSFGLVTNNLSWYLVLKANGTLQLTWSPNGTFASARSATSTVSTGFTNGSRHSVRVTMDADNGFGGCTVTFYTSSDIDSGPWTQLGSAVTSGGTTSIAITAAEIEIGTTNDSKPGYAVGLTNFIGGIYAVVLLNGIGAGSIIAAPRFNQQDPGVTQFTDINGTIWRLTGDSVITRDYVDITSDVNERGKIQIKRGRPNETSTSDPTSCHLELANTAGKYSPRNPLSPYYGVLNRATPIRVGVGAGSSVLTMKQPQYDFAFCYDSAGVSLTGDQDIRVDVDLSAWGSVSTTLAMKSFSGQSSWLFLVVNNQLLWLWSSDGTNTTTVTSIPIPRPSHGRKAVRVTHDVNNGAGGNTVTFYTSDSISGTWTQLGSSIVNSGTTSIFDSTSEIVLGGWSNQGPPFRKFYGFDMKNSIGGSSVANPDFTLAAAGSRMITDGPGNQWFLAGSSEITDQDWRFSGEVYEWPIAWDNTGKDVYSQIAAGGVLRRLNQGTSSLHSTLWYAMTHNSQVKAYWPCEDDSSATQMASALPGKPAMTVTAGQTLVKFASDSGFACSQPIPQFKLSSWSGTVPDYDNSQNNEFNAWFLVHINTPVAADTPLMRVWCNSPDTPIWQLSVDNAGNLRLIAVGPFLNLLLDTGAIGFGVNGQHLRISLELRQNGANIDWAFLTYQPGDPSGLFFSGTLNTATLGKCVRLDFGQDGTLDDVSLGQVSVNCPILGLFSFKQETVAWVGETAAARVARLCNQEGIGYEVTGLIADTTPMGPQRPKALLDLLKECETTDGGILTEPRNFVGFSYRTRSSMYRQGELGGPTVTLDYSSAHLSSIKPVDDDQLTKNDVTAKREDGGSARQTLDDGSSLSIGEIGRFSTTITSNVQLDSQLVDKANWNLHLGTVDEARYPSITVELARNPFVQSSSLTKAIRNLNVGDKIVIQHMPAWMPPEDVEQLAIGFTETLWNFLHTFQVTCQPEKPWHIAVYDNTNSRYNTMGCVLVGPVNTVSTSLSVFTPSGPVWTHVDGDFDINIAGERMTVTGVSGAGAQQTLTVTRSVNGIVKSHQANEPVNLFNRVYYGE